MKECTMNIRLLSTALAGVLLASGTALAHDTRFTTVEVWTNDVTTSYTTTTSPRVVYVDQTPRAVYVEQTPRVVYVEGTTRYYDADGNRIYTTTVYPHDWMNRSDAFDPTGRGLSPAEVSNLTHNVDSTTSGMPRSGTGVQPGNMGPANSKGQ
jgi:hypothetical protein